MRERVQEESRELPSWCRRAGAEVVVEGRKEEQGRKRLSFFFCLMASTEELAHLRAFSGDSDQRQNRHTSLLSRERARESHGWKKLGAGACDEKEFGRKKTTSERRIPVELTQRKSRERLSRLFDSKFRWCRSPSLVEAERLPAEGR